MYQDELKVWGQSVIDRVKIDRLRFSKKPLEFSIFYSPLLYQPELLIVGDNPGGKMDEPGLYEIPEIHEYLNTNKDYQYKLAVAMRTKVLSGEMQDALTKSVKVNRIFFRTPDMKTFRALPNSQLIEKYCFEILDKIIEKLKPKRILTESFGAFEALSKKCVSVLDRPETKKALIVVGEYKGIEVIGINHPSSSRGLTDDDWKLVNQALAKRVG